jgi:hypothetical protein
LNDLPSAGLKSSESKRTIPDLQSHGPVCPFVILSIFRINALSKTLFFFSAVASHSDLLHQPGHLDPYNW